MVAKHEHTMKLPKVRYNLNIRKGHKEGLIILTFRYRGDRLQYSTRCTIHKNDWDKKKQRPIEQKGKPELTAIRRTLDSLADVCLSIYRENDFGAISADDFKKEMDYRTGRKKRRTEAKMTPLRFFQEYIDEKMRRSKSGTRKVYELHLSNLRKFAADRRAFDFDDVDLNLRHELIEWMAKNNFQLAYGNKLLSILRKLMNEARDAGHHNNDKYNRKGWTVKSRLGRWKKATLTELELNILAKKELTGLRELVRDVALIGCGTGARWSDFSEFGPDNYGTTRKGTPILTYVSQKTSTKAVVPLVIFDWLIPVLEKHAYQTPVIPHQVFNREFKELCRECGFDSKVPMVYEFMDHEPYTKEKMLRKYELISAHTTRRTFATLSYFKLGAARSMKMTGHKTESVFFDYIGVDDDDNADAIAEELEIGERSPLKIAQ